MTIPLPSTTTPEALAEHMGWSARRVRKVARDLGACRILGNRMVLLDEDVKVILEAAKPRPSKSTSAGTSGIIAGLLPDGDYEALKRLRARKLPGELSQTLKPHKRNRPA